MLISKWDLYCVVSIKPALWWTCTRAVSVGELKCRAPNQMENVCCYRATKSTTQILVHFWSKPVGNFLKGALCSAFTMAFSVRRLLNCIDSMPLLCICGAKFLFAIVFTVVMFRTSQYIPLLNHCIQTLFPVCHVYSFNLLQLLAVLKW